MVIFGVSIWQEVLEQSSEPGDIVYLLQENGDFLEQEDGSEIIVTVPAP